MMGIANESALATNSLENTALVKLDAARHALAEAHSVFDVKRLRDQALAMQEYTQSQRFSEECIQYAVEIRIRAERRIGELLRELAENGERQTRGMSGGKGDRKSSLPTINDLGISKDHASQWQTLASIPEPDFEKWVPLLQTEDRLSTRALMEMAAEPKKEKEPRTKTIAETLLALANRVGTLRSALSKVEEVKAEWTDVCPNEMAVLRREILSLTQSLKPLV